MNSEQKKPTAILLCGIGGSGKTTTSLALQQLFHERGASSKVVDFDRLRRKLVPRGCDPYSADLGVKEIIYEKASELLRRQMTHYEYFVVDCGTSSERLRCELRDALGGAFVVHLTCPLPVAILRDTLRSLARKPHARGKFLYLHALLDLINPFKAEKFPQPGITYHFEDPACADVQIRTLFKKPEVTAVEIVESLKVRTGLRVRDALSEPVKDWPVSIPRVSAARKQVL